MLSITITVSLVYFVLTEKSTFLQPVKGIDTRAHKNQSVIVRLDTPPLERHDILILFLSGSQWNAPFYCCVNIEPYAYSKPHTHRHTATIYPLEP